MLTHFNYGQPFLEINAAVLKRYAACKNEAEVKQAEEKWLAKIEKEYANNRGGPGGEGADAWKGGNLNFKPEANDEDEDEDEEGEEEDDGADEESGGLTLPNPLAPLLPDPSDGEEDEDEEEEEERMAEIRRRVLASKPFTNPTPSASDSQPAHIKIISRPVAASSPAYYYPSEDSSQTDDDDEGEGEGEGEEGGEDDNELFDRIIDARPPTDRTGINKLLARKQDGSFVRARRVD